MRSRDAGRLVETRRWVSLVVIAVTLAASRPARATKNACFDAYVDAQRLRKNGKLRGAHDELLVCADSACPAMIKNDCVRWSAEVERAMPTVVFAAKDPAGQDMADVRVFVDGQKVADRIDGRSIALDPGPHKVRFEADTGAAERDVVLAEGETNRRIDGSLGAPTSPPPSIPGAPVAPEERSAARHVPVASVALGGIAVVGLASFIGFALAGKSAESCAPNCSSSQTSSLRRDYAIADVSWIVALAAAGAGVYLYLAQPRHAGASGASGATGASLKLGLQPAPGGAAIHLGGAF